MQVRFPTKIAVFAFVLLGGCASVSKSTRTPSSVEANPCGEPAAPIRRGDIECLTRTLIERRFPELERAWNANRIAFQEFDSDAYFLKTSFLDGKLRSDPNSRKYSVDVNRNLYDPGQRPDGPPSHLAVEGILAHELVHLLDYERSTPLEIVRLGTNLVLNPNRIERETDERAFERGFAEGIKAYRRWIYGKLSPGNLRIKRARYYTPEEIDRWEAANRGSR